jgi:glycosyltransferase involved in cell wall biosynthesis
MNYEVTIGIPVYKAVDYIEKTMESALNQLFGSIEYLVVDDYGNDGTIDVVERLQKEHQRGKDIRILYNKQNLGVGKTRNIILDQAQGEYLFFLDSDDIIEPDAIEKMMRAARQYQAEIVYGSWIRVDNVNHSTVQHNYYPNMLFMKVDELAMYAFKNYSTFRISVCNVLFSLNLIRSSHLCFIDTIYWEDLAFTYDLVPKVSRAVLLSDITYQYHCRPGSLSNYQDREQLNKSEILNNALTLDYLKEKSIALCSKSYFPYLYYNLETNSFYIVCYILKNHLRISPKILDSETRMILSYPLSVWKVIRFRHKRLYNLMYCGLAHMPSFLSLFFVKFLGKMKKVI